MKKAYKLLDSFNSWWKGSPAKPKKKRKYTKRKK
jgi:hypothetical protein|tara:strand:- start:150 stop:251 length:102 start_codon:yes stop_codon:yes gene_type:complete